jgi:hypothetical protein
MKSEHQSADANKDGIITLDELVAKLQAYSSSSSSSGSRDGRDSTSSGSDRRSWWGSKGSTSSKDGKTDEKKGYRLAAPIDRLPKGLPDWFLRNDANADGQIAMVEFASTWTNQMAADFQKYDLNSDGFITPDECLEADKKK